MSNIISGKIVVKEGGLGIPDLLVSIYALDPSAHSNGHSAPHPTNSGSESWADMKGDRLGSVLTGRDGTFQIPYEDGDFQNGGAEKRPALSLIVTAPEENGNSSLRLLY